MKKLRLYCKSLLLSCLLVPCLCCGLVVSAIDPTILIETAVAAIELTCATADALSDSNAQIHQENVSTMFKALDEQNGNSSVTVLNYMFIQGKAQIRYLCSDNTERFFNVDMSMYYLDNYSGSVYNDGNDCPIVHGKDGLSYLANNIYFDIWYSDGTHYRIRHKPDSYLSLAQRFASNSFIDSNILMYIYRPSSGRFFNVTESEPFGTELPWSNSATGIGTYSVDRNSIVMNPYCQWYDNDSHKYIFNNNATDINDDTVGMVTRNMSLGYFPNPKSICYNRIAFREQGTSSSVDIINRPIYYLGAFFDTNCSSLNSNYNSAASSKKQSSVQYYDNTCIGGTTIDNSNKTTVLGGILSNDFDVNGLFAGIADLQATIKPLLDLSLPDITSLTTNFFENMPDWNTNWNTTRDNDYYVLPWEDTPPDIPTTGIVVDITRPLIPEVNTNPHISFSYPTVTTTALPPSVISAGADFVEVGKDITDMVGTTNIIVVCGLIGVGVMLIFKDW